MKDSLFIRLGQASIDFAWKAAGQDEVKYVPYELKGGLSPAAHLREALRTSVPSHEFGTVLVMVSSPTMLVPVDEFVEDEADMLYHHVFPATDNRQQVGHSVVPMLDVVALFAIDNDVHRVVSGTFAEARFLPMAQPLWEYLSHHAPQQFNVCFIDGVMHVFSVRNNRFRFCNSFEVNSADDAAYLSLNAWTQLGMDAEHDVFCVVGQSPGDGRFEQTIRRYVRKVYVRQLAGELGLPEPLSAMPVDMQAIVSAYGLTKSET
ncbi:MAG: DUF3822 family protein [Prevotella sp.]|nr:DUF3822 family protein [Prevotella sp.]